MLFGRENKVSYTLVNLVLYKEMQTIDSKEVQEYTHLSRNDDPLGFDRTN